MFEKQKWSKELKRAAEDFLEIHVTELLIEDCQDCLAKLIKMAFKEGRQEVLDDPSEYDLMSTDSCEGCEPWEDDEDCR